MTARLLDLTHDAYLAHQAFSSSTAKVLLERSPLHARLALGKRPTKEMDRGQVVHRLVLGKGADFEVLQHDSYRKDKAKSERDAARAAGRVPILEDEFADANVIAETVRVKLAESGVLLDGVSEQAIEWTEDTDHGPVLCKGRFDHVWLNGGNILDLKITGDASQTAIERTAENLNYAVQSSAYPRALTALRPEHTGRVRFLFAFVEDSPPYAMNLVVPDGPFEEIGTRRWMRAVREWARCTALDDWPGYSAGINTISPPPWALAREGYSRGEG